MKKIKQFLESGIFYDPYLDLNQFIQKIESKKDKKIKLVYGETYDEYGLTIDSLKYYLILNTLHNLLEKSGFCVTSHIIVGDFHSIINNSVRNKTSILEQINKNVILIKKILQKFCLKSKILLMSDLLKTKVFKSKLDFVTNKINYDSTLKNCLKNTVLNSKLKEESVKDFLYTREEVTLILDYNIKIGPPREKNYDDIANKINPSFSGLYLKPTYPIGKNFDFFIQHPQIEEFGITPYKAGSNKLQKNRIIIEKFDESTIKSLIKNTFISSDSSLPNPLLDLIIILNLAKRCKLSNFEDFLEYSINNKGINELPEKLSNLIMMLK